MNAIERLIAELSEVCPGLPDQRTGLRRDNDYTMAGISLSAFSVFFLGTPLFLAHQRAREERHGQSHCETLFGMSAIPSNNDIRMMPDAAAHSLPTLTESRRGSLIRRVRRIRNGAPGRTRTYNRAVMSRQL